MLSEAEISALAERELPGIQVDSVSYLAGVLSITWPAVEGEVFSLWRSDDLGFWFELNDSVGAGAEGGRYEYMLEDPQADRQYLQVRRGE